MTTYDWTTREIVPYVPVILEYNAGPVEQSLSEVYALNHWLKKIIIMLDEAVNNTHVIERPIPTRLVGPPQIRTVEEVNGWFGSGGWPSFQGARPLFIFPGSVMNWQFNSAHAPFLENPFPMEYQLQATALVHKLVVGSYPTFGICGGFQLIHGACYPSRFLRLNPRNGGYAVTPSIEYLGEGFAGEQFIAPFDHSYGVDANEGTFYKCAAVVIDDGQNMAYRNIDVGGVLGPDRQAAGGVQWHPEWEGNLQDPAVWKALSILYHTIRFSEKVRNINV